MVGVERVVKSSEMSEQVDQCSSQFAEHRPRPISSSCSEASRDLAIDASSQVPGLQRFFAYADFNNHCVFGSHYSCYIFKDSFLHAELHGPKLVS